MEKQNDIRWYATPDGKIYCIRDRWVGDTLYVEYAVVRDGEAQWLPTEEGVLFSSIEPIGEYRE